MSLEQLTRIYPQHLAQLARRAFASDMLRQVDLLETPASDPALTAQVRKVMELLHSVVDSKKVKSMMTKQAMVLGKRCPLPRMPSPSQVDPVLFRRKFAEILFSVRSSPHPSALESLVLQVLEVRSPSRSAICYLMSCVSGAERRSR